MKLEGTARYGVSIVFRMEVGELRFTNLTEEEAREVLKKMWRPYTITTSRPNHNSQSKDTREEALKTANKLRAEIGLPPLPPRNRN